MKKFISLALAVAFLVSVGCSSTPSSQPKTNPPAGKTP